jgi:hypothetical protein
LMISLIIAVTFLISYFIYQVSHFLPLICIKSFLKITFVQLQPLSWRLTLYRIAVKYY